jgi:hypothetical protein
MIGIEGQHEMKHSGSASEGSDIYVGKGVVSVFSEEQRLLMRAVFISVPIFISDSQADSAGQVTTRRFLCNESP